MAIRSLVFGLTAMRAKPQYSAHICWRKSRNPELSRRTSGITSFDLALKVPALPQKCGYNRSSEAKLLRINKLGRFNELPQNRCKIPGTKGTDVGSRFGWTVPPDRINLSHRLGG